MRLYTGAAFNNNSKTRTTCLRDTANFYESGKRESPSNRHTIAYWRDIEGAKMSEITAKDLYMKDWPRNRIRSGANLPCYYCLGNQFILQAKAFPNELPLNLKGVRELQERLAKTKQKVDEIKNKSSVPQTEKFASKNKKKRKKRKN